MDVLSLSAMLMVGLMGAGHCVGMCGGISAALGLAGEHNRWSTFFSYHLGRITSYALAGLMIGLLGLWGRDYLSLGPILRLLAGVLLILMGLYMADWWRGLTWLEKGGSQLWRFIQPLGKGLLPVQHFYQGYLLGMVWGWLPCGLVYTALAYSATSSSPLQGAAMMLAFGVGTLPAVMAGSVFSGQLKTLLQKKGFRRIMALLLIAFGLWTLWGNQGGQHGAHHGREGAAMEQNTQDGEVEYKMHHH